MSLFELKATKVPAFNEPLLSPGVFGITTQPSNYDDLDYWITRTPELIRVVSSVQEDILGEGVYFDGAESAVKKAESFWEEQFIKEELKKAMFDWLLYGDGYLWKGKLSNAEIESVRSKALMKIPAAYRHLDFKVRDEDAVNFLRHVPSSTMNIHLNRDKTSIERFEQRVTNSLYHVWNPEEIVHSKYWTVKGKVYGFSPAMALLVELQAIGYIKDYATGFFKEGGYPDWAFIFPNEPANSPRLREVRELLQKFKHPIHKHGNMVVSGELDLKQLNQFSKDMEFRQLLIQVTGIIAHAYGLPAGRISSIIGAEVKVSTGSDDLANEAYWSMIRGHKDYWETVLNTQVFSNFGKVKIQFPLARKVDEVRMADARIKTTDYLHSLKSLGVDFNMRYVKDLLSLKNEYLNSQELNPPEPDLGDRQGFEKDKDMERGTARQGLSREKRSQQRTSVSDRQQLGV